MKRYATGVTEMVAAIACFAFILVVPAGPVSARTMKIQSAFPHGDLSCDTLKDFAAAVEKHSGGKIKVKTFADPDLVPVDQLFGATKNGVVEMMQGAGVIWEGSVPSAGIEFGLPWAYRLPHESDFSKQAGAIREFFFQKGGFMDIMRAEYAKHGLYLLDIHTYGPVPFLLTTKPYNTCDDFKGKKIRTDGILHEYWAGVGALGAAVSGTDAYMALKLGTVDAAEWDISCVTGLKWNEVAPYWDRGMENNHAIGSILVNLNVWKRLSDGEKQALQQAGEDYWNATVAAYGKELANVGQIVKDGKLTIVEISPDCQNKFKDVAFRIWDEVAKRDSTCAKMVELLKQWHAKD